jgi:hypothetical protein
MRVIWLAGAVGVALSLSGCANTSANMRVGTDISYLSLKDQREASIAVREYEAAPKGAENIGKVDASRCHRNTLQAPPTDTEIKVDLKVAAYARGADGITDIKIERESGLLQNCCNVINGTATAFVLKK